METYNRIQNCTCSQKTEDDWDFTHAVNANFIPHSIYIPQYLDLRDDYAEWNVADQKETGSCVGWAVADSCMRWHFKKHGLLLPEERLSVRFIWMASKENDEFDSRPTSFLENTGTSIKAALDVARKYGCVKEEFLKFNYQLSSEHEKTFYSHASRHRILNYFNLKKSSVNGSIVETDLNDWKKWFAAGNGPIIVRLNKDIHFENASKENANLDIYSSFPSKLGHAAAIVGYTADNRFIIRNSYGESWGDGGYAYATLEYARSAFSEAYGICVR